MKTVIIGGAATGMGVAAKLKRLNPEMEIKVIQKENYVSLGACGIPYYIGNHFDNSQTLIARTVEKFREQKIEVIINSNVTKIDFKNHEVYYNNNVEYYDNLVIATGAKPIIPSIENISGNNIFTVSTKQDGENIRAKLASTKNVLVVGSGLIGLEMIENIKTFNSKIDITIIEKSQRPLQSLFDEEFTSVIEEKMAEKNINLIKNNEVDKFVLNNHGDVKGAILKTGEKILCDMVILAIGFAPNTEFLQNSGLNLNSRGSIIIDKYCQTNFNNVYAGGDCAETFGFLYNDPKVLYLATIANKHAKIIANNIFKAQFFEFKGTLGTAIVRFFDLELARTGENNFVLENQRVLTKSVLVKDKDHTNYLENQNDLVLKLTIDQATKQIVNAQILGKDKAVMRIYGLIGLMWSRTSVDEHLEQIDLPYSPPFSRTTDIIQIAISKLV
ncbi:CoA-disulfide reductase [Mesoplasma syrphidae]|uniref:CoA-disulfide reductase n=1 Tax=Mesoplasma syrphidae TaxID=225999 RepID=A0A2K9C650_9MOLU|nr:FAD-dependent oxidoreductase [Mesoplasma syrphidae]AUF83767.1 CoA-disulfide reductase [Mesoplasma syrphidae]